MAGGEASGHGWERAGQVSDEVPDGGDFAALGGRGDPRWCAEGGQRGGAEADSGDQRAGDGRDDRMGQYTGQGQRGARDEY